MKTCTMNAAVCRLVITVLTVATFTKIARGQVVSTTPLAAPGYGAGVPPGMTYPAPSLPTYNTPHLGRMYGPWYEPPKSWGARIYDRWIRRRREHHDQTYYSHRVPMDYPLYGYHQTTWRRYGQCSGGGCVHSTPSLTPLPVSSEAIPPLASSTSSPHPTVAQFGETPTPTSTTTPRDAPLYGHLPTTHAPLHTIPPLPPLPPRPFASPPPPMMTWRPSSATTGRSGAAIFPPTAFATTRVRSAGHSRPHKNAIGRTTNVWRSTPVRH